MYDYVGPKGYGSVHEFGGTLDIGTDRMQSVASYDGKLTKLAKEQITEQFAEYGLEVKKIEKLRSGCLRVAYNGEAWKYTGKSC